MKKIALFITLAALAVPAAAKPVSLDCTAGESKYSVSFDEDQGSLTIGHLKYTAVFKPAMVIGRNISAIGSMTQIEEVTIDRTDGSFKMATYVGLQKAFESTGTCSVPKPVARKF